MANWLQLNCITTLEKYDRSSAHFKDTGYLHVMTLMLDPSEILSALMYCGRTKKKKTLPVRNLFNLFYTSIVAMISFDLTDTS